MPRTAAHGMFDDMAGRKAAFMEDAASVASNPKMLSPVKTIRSGFSALIIRLMKILVLRSEQWESWLGKTSSHGVFLPSA